MEILMSLCDIFSNSLGTIVLIYMIKYFSCQEVDINKKVCVVYAFYEVIVIVLNKLNIMSDEIIYDLFFIIILLFYTYKFQAIKKIKCFISAIFVYIMIACIAYLFFSIFSQPILWGKEEILDKSIDNIIMPISIIVFIFIILFIRKSIKKNIYISITKTDVFILFITLVISFILLFIMDAFKEITIYDELTDRSIIAFIGACGIIMNISILTSMFKAKSAYYYKNMNEINEHYMEMQLKHFEAYKNSQIETRRIKHDMKNHIICINELLERNNIYELKMYIDDLKKDIKGIDKNFKTGNIILDSIINEKYEFMKKENIEFHISGYMDEENSIKPVDICTIFANAIDNAIEGSIKENDKSKRKIDISIKENKNFRLITIINNMVMVKKNVNNVFITTKSDKINHGFGISNIKYTLSKYNGSLNIEMINNNFILEIVLPK